MAARRILLPRAIVGGKLLYSPLFYDGFELGNLDKWDESSNVIVVTDPVHRGTYAAQGTDFSSYLVKHFTDYHHLFYRVWMHWINMTTGSDLLMEVIDNDALSVFELNYYRFPPYKLYMMDWDDPANGYIEGTHEITAGWRCIQIEIDRTDGGYIRVWLDGVLDLENSVANRPPGYPYTHGFFLNIKTAGYTMMKTIDGVIIDVKKPDCAPYPDITGV